MHEENIVHGPKLHPVNLKNLTLGEIILEKLSAHKSWTGLVDVFTGEELTMQDILDNSKKIAIALRKEGLKMDDRIAICSENNIKFPLVVCAAFYLGVTVCPLNPSYTEREMIHVLNISKPKYIFISPISAKNMLNVVPQLPWSPKLIMLTESTYINLPSIKSLISNITIDDNFRVCTVDVNNHVAVISCSSGTTGLPKGVMITDKNVLTVLRNFIGTSSKMVDVNVPNLAFLPYFHAYAFTCMLLSLTFGNKSIIIPRFDEKLFLHTIEKYKIEHIVVVPPIMVFLAKHPAIDKYDLSSIKEIWSGAAPLSEDVAKMVENRLNKPIIRQGYGLTETTLGVLMTPPEGGKLGSVGKLFPGLSAKVIPIDEDGTSKPLGPHSVGELCFKGDTIMKGYCNNEAATAATIDKDGWLHTGDVGYYDEEYYFFIVDRIKELIKYKGFQVPPAEMEAVLLMCPEVKDAAVIGLPDEAAGELPTAFIVKQEGSNITTEELHKFVNERVSSYKRLRGGIKFVETIPKTASGKILRRVLRDSLKSKL
ncbi:luciferin 4-monooxygenase [Xylocopa sonorina]|uniref:luciferin 4-monooxygenase n=1 Tax=Xylocopa sonorina TaxID=1818115 RepID=UPI00403B2372